MFKKNKLFITFLSLLGIFWVANLVLAQGGDIFGFDPINNTVALSATDPRIIIGRLIQIILAFLGVITLVLIMYAGFLWMTSGGDEDKVSKAKAMIKNAVIGLVIILSSWGIATFIISRLWNATGGPGGLGGPGGGGGGGGVGAFGACTIDSYYPTNGQKDVPRNTSIMITFKEEVKLNSVCLDSVTKNPCDCGFIEENATSTTCDLINPEAIRIYKTKALDACTNICPTPNANITEVKISVASGNKTLVLMPQELLGDPNINTEYSVKLSNSVKKLDGSSMFKTCNVDYAEWGFEVNTKVDLTPPIVLLGGVFPIPDNLEDISGPKSPAVAASGTIAVSDCPKIYRAATVDSIVQNGGPTATVSLNYAGQLTEFMVTVDQADYKASLSSGPTPLGNAVINSNGEWVFNNYLTLKPSGATNNGNYWTITITPEQLADTLTVGSENYVFATSTNSAGNNIPVFAPGGVCDLASSTDWIALKVNNSEVSVSQIGSNLQLTAKVAGSAGNNLPLVSNSNALSLIRFSGGIDSKDISAPQDKKDRPMNSVIQINFNEAINPLTIAGPTNLVSSSTDAANKIKVVNASSTAKSAGSICLEDSDCASYKCELSGTDKKCVGDFVTGKFVISNLYRTVEFISDKECGVNGCGEKIYCLPPNSHLAVKINAANLKKCDASSDCTAFTSYNTCATSSLPYKTCQNKDSKNFPLADTSGSWSGVTDASLNSFDGNRSVYSEGPIAYYNDNFAPEAPENTDKKDRFQWSFYINDKIMLEPPVIEEITPGHNSNAVNLINPIVIKFNTLMMNSSLTTGVTSINNGSSTTEHKLINLKSNSLAPLGYWIYNENIDTTSTQNLILDGEPDLTITNIGHSVFYESNSYQAQVGSGVKDIYQNCYKPSAGPLCSVSMLKPSCCFGQATSTLGSDGNCLK